METKTHYITTSVNVSQEHSLFFSLSIQSKEKWGVAERDFAGAGQRIKRRSVHVCYVNVCMFVHFESIQECVVFCAHNCTCEWVNVHVPERSACIRNIRQAQRCNQHRTKQHNNNTSHTCIAHRPSKNYQRWYRNLPKVPFLLTFHPTHVVHTGGVKHEWTCQKTYRD